LEIVVEKFIICLAKFFMNRTKIFIGSIEFFIFLPELFCPFQDPDFEEIKRLLSSASALFLSVMSIPIWRILNDPSVSMKGKS